MNVPYFKTNRYIEWNISNSCPHKLIPLPTTKPGQCTFWVHKHFSYRCFLVWFHSNGLQCQDMYDCPGTCFVDISVQTKFPCHLECWEMSLAPIKLISQQTNYWRKNFSRQLLYQCTCRNNSFAGERAE